MSRESDTVFHGVTWPNYEPMELDTTVLHGVTRPNSEPKPIQLKPALTYEPILVKSMSEEARYEFLMRECYKGLECYVNQSGASFEFHDLVKYALWKNRAGCGGVIRGNQGELLGGFAKGVGNYSSFIVELWGVIEGLCPASRLGFTNVEFSIDSQAVVEAIKHGKVHGSAGCALIKMIPWILERNWNVKIMYA
ncbi:hypothetical protein TSUD_333490 [Trifolium subterraneum]|uniref:RNase H type-1 domain-containing protein n=1 Tax=Trifolium subterraneum TaxID=3900 RepID=A0A2Z6MKX1_TRISU|nr:hypothetical protein TSUD_333490 [Trifolium subterraneum]